MKTPVRGIQEDDLHAYVDKQLSDDKRQAVEELMRKDPSIAAQIHQWQQQNEAIASYFDKKSFEEIPEQLNLAKLKTKTHQEEPKPQAQNRYFALAASLFLMLASGLIGWFSHGALNSGQQNTSNFSNLAISAYEVFSVEVLHPVEVGADNKDHLLAWLSKRIDHSIKMPKLEKYGFKLLGGRLLSMQKGRPAAQFMFENKQGKRITWLVSKSAVYKDHAFFFKKEKSVNSFYWMDSKVAYSVSGELDRDILRELSQGIYQQINNQTENQLANL